MNILYFLQPGFKKNGDTSFRSVGVVSDDIQKMIHWHGCHEKGREIAQSCYERLRFEWRDPVRKMIADFPSSSEPGGIYSAKAIVILRDILERSGDIHPLIFEDEAVEYFLFDCWSRVSASPNVGFNPFLPGSLKTISVEKDSDLTDIFAIDGLPGLLVSERFKAAAEAAGLTGMVFTEVEVIRG